MSRLVSTVIFLLTGMYIISSCTFWPKEYAFSPTPPTGEEQIHSGIMALDQMDESSSVLIKKAELLLEKQQVREAAQLFEQVDKSEVDLLNWLWLKCQISNARGDIADGIKAGEELLNRGGEFFDLHVEMAELYTKADIPAEAAKQYGYAIYLNPNDPGVYRSKGDFALASNDTLLAVNLYSEAINRGIKDKSFLDDYILLLLESGDFSERTEVLNNLFKVDPENPLLTLLAARSEIEKGNISRADSSLSRKFVLANLDRPIILIKCNLKTDIQQYDSAIFYADNYLAQHPDKNVYQIRGKAYDKKYKYQEALNSYILALRIDTADVNTKREIDILHRKIAYLRKINEEKERRNTVIEPLAPIRRTF